jgi:hypothetical protein
MIHVKAYVESSYQGLNPLLTVSNVDTDLGSFVAL